MKPRTLLYRAAGAGLFAALLATLAAQPAQAERDREARRRGFNLLRASSTYTLQINRVQCGMNNFGDICTDTFGSPTGGGGFWPGGTPNQYIFNSGLQVAGIIPLDAPIWAGDTVGAYFFDARGTQPQGQSVTEIYSSNVPEDAANWPNGAVIRDADVYNAALLGRNAISQEDVWVRYWDGPSLLSGRRHPMGILVEHRGLAWNFPSGNQDIIYWVFTFYNITATDRAAYNTLDPAIQDEIHALAQAWVAETEDRQGVDIPPQGYRMDSLFSAFSMDPDVGDAGHNAATAILPFGLGVAYKSDFDEPTWSFPPEINGPPFGAYPGFVGVKYLKSPLDPATGQPIGLSLFSNYVNGQPFPDPVGVSQLWRYLSGRIDQGQGDPPCTIPTPITSRVCALIQNPVDIRFFQSSGPMSLAPGQSATIVVAYIHAAPVASVIEQYIPGDVAPGIPPSGEDIATDPANLRHIELANGWLGQTDANQDGEITQDEVQTLDRSLLRKALAAQAIFDAKFLLPFAPEVPEFYLVPGDNQVTVVWQPSPTETLMDPYYAIASDPTSALYDPNYRDNDVEGYRIWRGRSRGSMSLIAQFDYSGTTFVDYVGAWDYGAECAPELGITTTCPTFPASHDLNGAIPQVPTGGRAELAVPGGTVIILNSLNAVEDAGFPALANTGVPFAYVDDDVVNSISYYYAVTAFDVNSANSIDVGTLESPRTTKSVTPRAPSPNEVQASLTAGMFGDDEVELDPTGVWRIDANTGRFIGTPPPTNGIEAVFAPLVPQLLPGVTLTATIDSVRLRQTGSPAGFDCGAYDAGAWGSCFDYHVTFSGGAAPESFLVRTHHPVWSPFDGVAVVETQLGSYSVPADAASAARFGIPDGFASFTAKAAITLRETIRLSAYEGQYSRRYLGGAGVGGSRWFSGDDETVDHPTYGVRVGSGLPGVDSVWAPIHHTDWDMTTAGSQPYGASGSMQCFGYAGVAAMMRQADIKFTWGSGTVSEVRDLTHRVDVNFHTATHATWGFVGDNNGNGYIDWRDFNYLEPVSVNLPTYGFCAHTDPGPAGRGVLSETPTVLPVAGHTAAASSAFGTGIGVYVNGQRFIFALTGGQLPPSGTEWTLRSHAGTVRAASGGLTATPSGYSFTPVERPPAVEGLQMVFNIEAATHLVELTDSLLQGVHTLPDPYYVTNGMEITPAQKVLKFVNLPPRAIIRIYSLSGVLVDVVEHNDQSLGGEATWNVRNRNNQFVASGVYFYHVETPEGLEKIGRFTVINAKGIAVGSVQQ